MAIYTDWSGEIEVIITSKAITGYHNSVSVDVPSDYVVVGGGASISHIGNSGALLTGSFPNMSLTKWTATSKDHLEKQLHTLTVYAIGIKLKGVTKNTLKSYMTVQTATTIGVAGKITNTNVNMLSGYMIVGGGAEIIQKSGPGVLLTKSSQDYYVVSGAVMLNSWRAQAKDHIEQSTADLKAYVIGIKKDIPGFGELETFSTRKFAWSTASSGAFTTTVDIEAEWVPTCVGAGANWNGYGRMLYSMKPSYHQFSGTTTDHLKADTPVAIDLVYNVIRKKK
ncbi:hypothetical protein G7050_17175 [Dysgonomonas sp. HDW5A]|uniref:hypothetical protein n=1 Tax=Dysgonomonas sp. HDW5A TaxID=2714926 RepID=UPI00140AC649|nr:hypothetical protein [Dysgonomonas sp. HDW5A]QIK61482.1 hypothetical protein G7050_17175 [Dysgonomonas sp. HDW5A]